MVEKSLDENLQKADELKIIVEDEESIDKWVKELEVAIRLSMYGSTQSGVR